ncbi:hypothetical protein [Bacillus cereus group sp. N15]|uniref:hypothetical protein n=1 Tax=Bacillus cereus group sp. N15 TaxID=2794588 RepID=UPI0018F797D3|nr:hypothetical protein [Bacillus cereus group sp. N15]MBJ8063412.1 hypothetical protein [Bacillus cereus group sp. N15]
MTWLSFFIGYSTGMMVALLIMKSCIEAKEVNEMSDIDESVLKEMEQLKAIKEHKESAHASQDM